MNNKPLVSIIIPVYNGSNFMREAIDSALAQIYKNIEVIVVNDGSNDNGETEKIALSYGDKIRYFHKENGGVSSALNLGIKNMNGEYFSWLSHDDKYTENKIQNQIDLLNRYGDPNLIAICGNRQIDKNSKYIGKGKRIAGLSNREINSSLNVLERLFINGTFNGCAFLIPKKVFDVCGLFNEELRYLQDSLMWIKIFLKGYSLVYNSTADSLNRVHDHQLTQTGRTLFHSDSEKVAKLLIPELLSIKNAEKGRLLYLYAKRNAKMNNQSVVILCLEMQKTEKLFSMGQHISLNIISQYGKVRPLIRRVYYKLFKKVKTN